MTALEDYVSEYDIEEEIKDKDAALLSCVRCCYSIRKLAGKLNELEELQKHIKKEISSNKKEDERRREFIKSTMQGWSIKSHKDTVFTISTRKKNKTIITDESKIPEEYFETIPVLETTLDKKRLFDAVENDGLVVEGVEIIEVKSIAIRGLK